MSFRDGQGASVIQHIMLQWKLITELKPRTKLWSTSIYLVNNYLFLMLLLWLSMNFSRNSIVNTFQMDSTYRAYSNHVPSYLQGRPKKVILHCLGREEKARKQFSEKNILESYEQDGVFLIQGNSGTYIQLILERKLLCLAVPVKTGLFITHFFLVFISKCNWGLNSLP